MIIRGDCLEELKKLKDKSVDLIYTDLPYSTKLFGKYTDCEWDKPIDLDKLWIELIRVKKLHTPLFFSCNVKLGFNLINTATKKCPFRYDICYKKSTVSGHLLSHKQPLRAHELIFVFYEKQPFYDISSHKHKFKGTDIDKRPTKNYKNNSKIYGKINRPDYKRKNGESVYYPPLPKSVLEIKSEKLKHSTQKPLSLMKWILMYYSKEGDTILDCCMGSGSMGVACKEMKREFIGIEKDNEIFEVAKNRINILL